MSTSPPATPSASAGLRRASNYLLVCLLLDVVFAAIPLGWMAGFGMAYEFVMIAMPIVTLIMYVGVVGAMGPVIHAYRPGARGGAAHPAEYPADHPVESATIVGTAWPMAIACLVGVVSQVVYLYIECRFVFYDEVGVFSVGFYRLIYICQALAFAALVLLLVKTCREVSRSLSRSDLVRAASMLYPILFVVVLGTAFVRVDIVWQADSTLYILWGLRALDFLAVLLLVKHMRAVGRALDSARPAAGERLPTAIVR